MKGEPEYKDRIRIVESIDAANQIHGNLDGCVLISEVDAKIIECKNELDIVNELVKKLFRDNSDQERN